MSIDILLPVDISCQAEYISAEAGAVGNQTVKPAKVRINQLDNISHEKHGEQRTRANDVPFPAAKESKTAYHSEHHERGIDNYFHLGERHFRNLAQCHCYAFAGHCNRTAFHFKGYT